MGYNSDYKGEALSDASVMRSAAIGNRIAKQIETKSQPRYDAALRHAIDKNGVHSATQLASQLLGISHPDACAVIARLLNTKANDIVSPHYE